MGVVVVMGKQKVKRECNNTEKQTFECAPFFRMVPWPLKIFSKVWAWWCWGEDRADASEDVGDDDVGNTAG